MSLKWYKEGQALLEEIKETQVEDKTLAFWYIGQCGFVYKTQRITVYIDPVLNDLTDENGVSRRYYHPPFSSEEVHTDYVLCTHAHKDHRAIETLVGIAKANPTVKFIMPEDCIEEVVSAGILKDSIIEAKEKALIELSELTILPISAAHPVHQKTESGGDVAVSYALKMGNIRVLHLGDTYLTDQLLKDLQALEPPHLFFTPINGQDYFRTARNCIGNLNVMEASRLAVLLKADMTIPMHYDMISGNTVDPLDFVRILRELDTSAKWEIPVLGERVIYLK